MDPRTDAEVIACSLESPASFGELFDRHATTMFRYFVRRVGPDDADSLLGELFRIAFEKRAGFDTERAEARPWLYGIASNLLARHRQGEARRLDATARLVNTSIAASDLLRRGRRPSRRLAALGRRRRHDRHAPAGRARHAPALRLGGHALRPDRGGARRPRRHRAFAAEPGAWPTPRTRRRERGRTGDSHPAPRPGPPRRPGRPRTVQAGEGEAHVHDRNDRHPRPKHGAAHRRCTRGSPTRTRSPRSSTSPACSSSPNAARPGWAGDDDEGMLAWLEFGDGVVMIGRATDAARDVHHLYSPGEVGHATVMINVAVNDIDSHYEHASPRAPPSRCRSRTPSTATGATRPTISKATTGTSTSRSTRSGPAGRTPADRRLVATSHASPPRRSGRCRRAKLAGVRFGIFFELSVPPPFDGAAERLVYGTPSSRRSWPTSSASTGSGRSSTTSSRATATAPRPSCSSPPWPPAPSRSGSATARSCACRR